MRLNKFLILLVALLGAACSNSTNTATVVDVEQAQPASSNLSIDVAYENRASNLIVEGQGVVAKVLADDNKGARHQKFLVKVASGKTLLFAHNIDLAPRVADINVGDEVTFKGEYVYNPKGGVVHWTHKDPHGNHAAGWIKHNGKTYE